MFDLWPLIFTAITERLAAESVDDADDEYNTVRPADAEQIKINPNL